MSGELQEEVDVVLRCEAEARVRLKQEQDTGRFWEARARERLELEQAAGRRTAFKSAS